MTDDTTPDLPDLPELAQTEQARQLAEDGGSALAAALRRALSEDDEVRASHQSYTKHSSNPW